MDIIKFLDDYNNFNVEFYRLFKDCKVLYLRNRIWFSFWEVVNIIKIKNKKKFLLSIKEDDKINIFHLYYFYLKLKKPPKCIKKDILRLFKFMEPEFLKSISNKYMKQIYITKNAILPLLLKTTIKYTIFDILSSFDDFIKIIIFLLLLNFDTNDLALD